ncbi:hypothetical protein POM88_011528 [Heracleum sosnowskyi]|uniref:Uncharacterized protein n=1 Tax=Heracleum sosnowskyi TaxID=360622 RepID=A0AAD8IY40_9APIA|nr:hypothetical protein POM88_011528 [Heracleum sosnowskyi]
MRGRLRPVRDAVKELDDEKSKLEAGGGRGNITNFGLPSGKELPDYDVNLLGGQVAYFDMCSVFKLKLVEIEAMLGQVQCSTQTMDIWLLTNEVEMCHDNLIPIETEKDLGIIIDMVDCNYKFIRLYMTSNSPTFDDEAWDFSFIQMVIDDRIQRIEDIRDEVEGNVNEVVEEDTEDEEEKQSFHGDSSNMDSSESDCPKPKKKVRRIPPPNPPYRARKRCGYSMLMGLFKNTEDTPVVIDEVDEMKKSEKKNEKKADEKKSEKKNEKKADEKKSEKKNEKKAEKKKGKQKVKKKPCGLGETSKVDKENIVEGTTPCHINEAVNGEHEDNPNEDEEIETVIDENHKQAEEEQDGYDSDTLEFEYDSTEERMKAEKGNASATREDGMEQDEKVDMETKRKEELAKNPEILSNFLQKIKATQDDLNAHKTVAENGATIAQKSPPMTKQLERKNPRSTPLKNATLVKSHGGVVKPFKPPSQTAAGVEYFERYGQ